MAKCPKCGADMVNDGDNLKCPNCNSTQIKESANAGQAKNGDAQQSELDLLKARLAELEKKQEKNDKVKTGSLSVKEKLAPVAVFFKKWGLKAVLPAALFLIAFITLLVCFCGLRGIYVNVDNPNEFYSFSPTSYEYHGTTLTGDEYVDEGTWKTGGGMLSLTYEDEMFGKITESCPFSHMSYDTIFITDALGDKKEFRRVSVLAYSTPQKTEYTLNLNGGSGSGGGENKLSIGSKINKPSEPTRRGYQFMGWYTTPDGWKTEGASQFNFNSRIWEDTTIYANWKDLITEYKLTGDMLPEEGVTFLEGDDLTQIYQSAGGVKEKIGNGSVVIEFKDENGKIVSGAAPRSNVTATLKEVVIGNNVSSIPDNAFKGCTSLKSVTIPDSVTSIGGYAFKGCTFEIKWGNNPTIETISSYAFSGYKGTSITIPNSATSIGDYAFDGCRADINWGNNPAIGTIGSYAFRGYRGTSITIPDSVTSIGEYAFAGCTAEINWGNNPTIETISSYAFSGYKGTSITIPDSVTSIGDWAFYSCDSLTSVIIGDGVTSIGRYAFQDCTSLTSVTIGDGVTSIGHYAFYDCTLIDDVYYTSDIASWLNISFSDGTANPLKNGANLYLNGELATDIVIPDSVTSIGDWAFYSCDSLTSVIIGDGVTSIGRYAFAYCTSLTSVTIGNGVTSIGGGAFRGCDSLETITVDSGNSVYHSAGNCLIKTATKTLILGCKNSVIPDDGSVTSIGEDAFYNCDSLTSITIPDSVTSIGSNAFDGCTAEINWGNNPTIETISSYAFSGYKGTSITIPDSVTSIGDCAFDGCTSLTSVTIGDGVTSIGDSAFYNCTSLTSVTIPDGVTSIGNGAFSGCYSLTIYCEAASKPSGWDNNWNYSDCPVVWDANNSDVADDGNIYYIDENGLRYTLKDTTATVVRQPKNLSGNIEIPASVSYKGITYSVTSIVYRAFYNCSSLTSVTIPDSVTSIGWNAFYWCTSLTSVTIGNSVTSIGEYAFSGCDSLTFVTIPDSVTSIGEYAFSGCTSLTSVTIGNGVTRIGEDAFYYCKSLTSVTYEGTVAQWRAISKGWNWNYDTPFTEVICSDGTW